MGDSGEGLIDADDRIQERLHEMAEERARRREAIVQDPAQARAVESLRLARTDLERQLTSTAHPRRRELISQALAELDRQIDEATRRLTAAS
jgi:hypothetical protein